MTRVVRLCQIDAQTGRVERDSTEIVSTPPRKGGCDFCDRDKTDGVTLVEGRGTRVCSACLREMRLMGVSTCPECHELGRHKAGCSRGRR